VGGAAIGVVYALIARPRDDVFITNSWSYVPADQWWLHGLLLGVLFALVYVGIVTGLVLAASLIRHMALFTVVGVFLLVMTAFFFGRAAFADESPGGRVAWAVMGALVGALAVPMIITEQRSRRRRRG
jgi:pilus assembly protein TadC